MQCSSPPVSIKHSLCRHSWSCLTFSHTLSSCRWIFSEVSSVWRHLINQQCQMGRLNYYHQVCVTRLLDSQTEGFLAIGQQDFALYPSLHVFCPSDLFAFQFSMLPSDMSSTLLPEGCLAFSLFPKETKAQFSVCAG